MPIAKPLKKSASKEAKKAPSKPALAKAKVRLVGGDLAPERVPMVFDLAAGLYWRPEEGGLLFGMSNPQELPGDNREVDEGYLALMRERLAKLVPVTARLGLRRIWAATIDYTPDHLPIIGPALDRDGPLAGVTTRASEPGGLNAIWSALPPADVVP